MSSDHQRIPSPTPGIGISHSDADIEASIKHPLQTPWTLYYKDPDCKSRDWNDSIKKVLAFDTVEDFWALYNNITTLSALKVGSDFSLFRGGVGDMPSIRPAWEDAANYNGGIWKFFYDPNHPPRSKVPPASKIDDLVRELFMTCVGEMYGDASETVNGVVASIRRNGVFRFEIWTKDCVSEAIDAVGNTILQILPTGYSTELQFSSNEATRKAPKGVTPNPEKKLLRI